MINPRIGLFPKSNNSPEIKVESMTMAILTKLFAINMVASKDFGFFINSIIALAVRFVEFSISFRSLIEREKKAISEAEINAEHPRRIIIPARAKIIPEENGCNKLSNKEKKAEGGSKGKR